MKTLVDVDNQLQKFEKKFNLQVRDAQQGSEAWQNIKLGVISASRAKDFVAKKGSATRDSYMAELVGQICTGIFPEINARPLDWGKDHEDAARSSYEFLTGNTVSEMLFAFKDDSFRVGCSPDGLVTKTKGVEIKCPYSTVNYIQFLTADKIKPEYEWQYQFTMWVLDAEEWDFCQYDPRMKKNPLHIHTVKRDEKKIKALEDAYAPFIEDMDKMLAKAGMEFGEHWARIEQVFEEGA